MSELRVATKFLKNNFIQQYEHLFSELNEVVGAYLDGNMDAVAEETVDLQMSCETMLAILGLDKKQRLETRKKVIEKNERRGYYDDDNDEKASD